MSNYIPSNATILDEDPINAEEYMERINKNLVHRDRVHGTYYGVCFRDEKGSVIETIPAEFMEESYKYEIPKETKEYQFFRYTLE